MAAGLGESTLDKSIRFLILLMSSCATCIKLHNSASHKDLQQEAASPTGSKLFLLPSSLPFPPTLNSSKPLASLPFCFLKHPFCPALPCTYYSALNCCVLRHFSLQVCWPMGASHTDFFSPISHLANCFRIPATLDVISLS